MLCQNCGENDANVRYTQIINGVKKQMSLCDKCAKDLGVEDINFNIPINFSSFLGGMFNLPDEDFIPTLIKPETLTCNKCNMTYDEFLEIGNFGCENCYEVFKTRIDPILKNIHGANRHVGRKSNHLCNIETDKAVNINKKKDINNKEKTQLEKLKEQLKKQIQEERYEDAAITRDRIKKIEDNK